MKNIIKHIIIIIIALFLSFNETETQAGQMPQFSQYMLNSFYYNPAVAGTFKRYILKYSHRLQWIGVEGAPQTAAISVFGPSKDFNMGYGGYVYLDNTGPTSRKGLMGSYAYNIPLFNEYRISFGLTAGMLQYYFDASSIELGILNDPAMLNSAHSKFIPDANFGAYMYSYSMYAGFAAHQLFGNKMKFEENDGAKTAEIQLVRHYYLIGGYILQLNRDWKVEPNLILAANYPEKPQFELTAQAVYQNMVWGGLSFRTTDKLSIFSIVARYKHERKYEFGISYDINAFSKYSMLGSGSVEVVIGYLFDELR